MTPHTDAGALLKLADELVIQRAATLGLNGKTRMTLDLIARIEIALRQAASQGNGRGEEYNAGLEAAAKYHDDAARDCDSIAAVNQDNELGPDCTTHAIDHRMAAEDIRALSRVPTCGEERSAVQSEDAVAKIIDGYADSYRMMANDGDGKVLASSVHTDLLCNIKPAIRAALGVAQAPGEPDFNTAAFALGFRRFEDGRWYSPTPSPSMNTAQAWDTAEQIFDWWGRASGNIVAQEASDCGAEIKRLRTQVEYWRLAAERREARKERSGVDAAEARTLDAPEYHAGEGVSLPSADGGGGK